MFFIFVDLNLRFIGIFWGEKVEPTKLSRFQLYDKDGEKKAELTECQRKRHKRRTY